MEGGKQIIGEAKFELARQDKSTAMMPMQLMQIAIQNNGAVEQLEKLMELQERWEARQAKQAYFSALASFQAEMPVIEKKKCVYYQSRKPGVPPTEYKYAPLDDIMFQIRSLLDKNGLSVRWEQTQDEALIKVTCIVTHIQGHSERVVLSGIPDQSGNKNNIQSTASTVTYLRRYTVTGALGIATADEDFDGRLPDYSAAKNEAQELKQLSEFNFYPDSDFSECWPKWLKAIGSGKITKQSLINKIESKGYTLTDEQIKQIEGIK